MAERPKSRAPGDAEKSSGGKRQSIRPIRPSAAPKARSKSLAPPPSGAKTVLVVEDDADIRALIVRALKGRYRVMEACDGLVAAELLDSLAAEPPDLLVCDIMMPRVDGISLVTMLKKDARLQAMPVVFLTAKSGPDDVLRGINVGARHYLTKPFSMAKLLDKVNAALAAG